MFTNFDEDVSAEDLKLADSLAAKIAAEEATLAVAQQVDDTEHPTALPRDPDNIPTHEYRSNKRLIRWLRPDGYYNNGRYLMNNLRHDIMQSSIYLNRARVMFPKVKFKTLPKPFYAPILRRVNTNRLLRVVP